MTKKTDAVDIDALATGVLTTVNHIADQPAEEVSSKAAEKLYAATAIINMICITSEHARNK